MVQLCADLGQHRQSAVPAGVAGHLQAPVWRTAAALLAHPGFDGAMLSYCRRMVEPSGFRWPANKIFAQKMRYITCYMLIGLAARFEQGKGPAPTLSSLHKVVPGSARQVSDLIAGLRAGGYILAEQNALDRREMWLRPSPQLVLEIARSPLCFLAAASLLEPHQMHRILPGDISLLSNMLARSMEAFQAQDILFVPFETVVDFTGRDSGYLILCAVMGAHLSRSAEQCFELPLSYDALSQRFQVSRQHVGNVLTGAARRGLFAIHTGRLDAVSPELIDEFRWWSAGQMAHFGMLATSICASIADNRRILRGDLEIR